MEGPSHSLSYEYKANVREKVQRLESTMLTPEEEPVTTAFRRILGRQQSDPLNRTKESVISDEKPAVMDVETTQINSGCLTNDTEATKPFPSSMNNNNNNEMGEPETSETSSVSVKGLLKKFTHGVVSVAQPFRRKSLSPQVEVSSEDRFNSLPQSSERNTTTVTRIQSLTPSQFKVNANERRKSSGSVLEKSTSSFEERRPPGAKGLLNNQSQKIKQDEQLVQKTTLSTLTSKTSFRPSNYLAKRDPQTTVALENPPQLKLNTSGPAFIEQRQATNLQKQTPTELSPKPKPRTATVPQKSVIDSANVFNLKNFASILVMGPGRAGKSSIVNHLVRQDLLPIHKQRPSTRDILELTAKVKIESSSDLSFIRIIDTPSFENRDEDASLFSTLIAQLDDENGFQGVPPTLLIVTIELDSWKNPFHSEDLVNFLKVISHYKKNFFDTRFSNFLFVVTHSIDLTTEKSRDVSIDVSNTIRQHTSIIEPIIAFHGGNQNHSNKASTDVQNLLGAIKSVSRLWNSGLETAGQMILNVAFGDSYPSSIQECFISKRIPLQVSHHPEVTKSLKLLQYIYLNIEPSEISTLLEIGWENVDGDLRQNNPFSLLTLQKMFQKCKIRNFSELPEEPLKVLGMLKQIPEYNLAITDLLTETLQLRIPSCYPALFVGQGYDVSRDSATHVSPFQFSGRLNASPVGLIPEEIGCKVTEDREIIFRFFYSLEDYVLDRMKDLSIQYVTFPKNTQPLATDHKTGYNIIKPNQEPTKTTTAKAVIEYRAFQLSLIGREDNLMEFKPQFWETLSSLPDLDFKKQETVDSWKEFFNYWGTHVIQAGFGGGSIQVNFRGKMLSNIFKSLKQDSVLPLDEYETSKVFQWITGDGLNFLTTNDDSKAEFLQGFDVETSFQGGDMKFQQMDLTKVSHHKVAEVREEWIHSLALNPVILETNLVLVPLSYFVREKSEGVATKLDVAFHYFYSDFMASQGKSSCIIL